MDRREETARKKRSTFDPGPSFLRSKFSSNCNLNVKRLSVRKETFIRLPFFPFLTNNWRIIIIGKKMFKFKFVKDSLREVFQERKLLFPIARSRIRLKFEFEKWKKKKEKTFFDA